jgi:hypothetical protein
VWSVRHRLWVPIVLATHGHIVLLGGKYAL